MHYDNVARGLAIDTRFDDHISRSQVCQNHKLQTVFRLFFTVLNDAWFAAHIRKIKQSIFCVTGLYLRDITNMIFVILHLNVSCWSVCSACVLIPVAGNVMHFGNLFVEEGKSVRHQCTH